MDRRELIKMIAILTGGAVVGAETFLTGCKSGGNAELGFSESNISLLNEVGEIILPATSTPGAKEAKVGEFMEIIVRDCYPPESQDAFMNGFLQLEEACAHMHSKGFKDCSPEQRKELLLSLEAEAKEFNKAQDEKDKPRRDELKKQDKEYDFVASPRHYYTMFKQLTLLGFFTSEVAAKKALRLMPPAPGEYDGALPYKEGDKAWAN